MKLLRLLVVLPFSLAPAIAPAAEPVARPQLALALDDDDEPIEVDLIELTLIDWQPGKEVPEKIKKLDGKHIRIKGLMAMGTVEGVDTFNLVTSGCSCGTTKLQHFVKVTLADDVTQFTPDELTLTGVFSVGEEEEDGFVTSLYRLKDAAIE
jgi:hypothetical protein